MTNVAIQLEELREPAPSSILNGVLIATGLADAYVRRPSALGDVFIAASERGISAVELAEDEARFEEDYEARMGRPALPEDELPSSLDRAVSQALDTGDARLLPFDLSGIGDFASEVLYKTAEIGSAQLRPYGWVANEIGRPGAVRAVGTALRKNPVPVLIPCHRVGRADGTLGEYALGRDRKRQILHAEGADVAGLEDLADRGIRYVGSDTTGIYCYPTCPNARRITDQHRQEFKDSGAASAAGHRPCKVCRPLAA